MCHGRGLSVLSRPSCPTADPPDFVDARIPSRPARAHCPGSGMTQPSEFRPRPFYDVFVREMAGFSGLIGAAAND